MANFARQFRDTSPMQRFVRSVSSALSLNTTALLAHHIAGGNTVSGPSLLSSLLILVTISLIFSHSDLEGPRLGLLIIFSQLFTHIVLGANSGNSTLMAMNHILSGLFVYFFIARIDQAILWLSTRFTPILLTAPASQFILHKSCAHFRSLGYSLSHRFVAFQYWTTSPPLVAKFS